jgi:hypothetical protein
METTKQVVVRFRPGDFVLDANNEKTVDKDGEFVRGAPIPVRTVEIKNLTASESMDADDFALAVSPTQNPSRDNRVRAFALCAIRKIDNTTVMRPRTQVEFEKLRDQFTPDELLQLGLGHIIFVSEINASDDPNASPSVVPSSP